MTRRDRLTRNLLPGAQIALVAIGLIVLTAAPPVNGAMVLIALDGRGADRLAGPAIADGARLLGRGPFTNMLVVRGARDRIAGNMLARGVLVLAAPQSWCQSESPAA